jgi:hypothetical protein
MKENLIILHFAVLAQKEMIWIRIHLAKIVRFQNVAGKEMFFCE